VIATDLKPPQETATKIGRTVTALQLDGTQDEDWRSASVKSPDVGDVDIVVNNAGYFPYCSIDELDPQHPPWPDPSLRPESPGRGTAVETPGRSRAGTGS
jgi:NADP-dependent 3-hydroxy acid dehydrogenase YdfG